MKLPQPLKRVSRLKKRWSKKNKFPIDSVVDSTRTVLEGLKESADAFPPLKSAVASVIAIRDTHRVRDRYVMVHLYYIHMNSVRIESEDV